MLSYVAGASAIFVVKYNILQRISNCQRLLVGRPTSCPPTCVFGRQKFNNPAFYYNQKPCNYCRIFDNNVEVRQQPIIGVAKKIAVTQERIFKNTFRP